MRHYLAGANLLVLLVIGSGFSFAQDPTTPNQTARPTVKLNLLVTDGKDRSVENVTKEEVQILEDGQPQVITLFEKDTRPTQFVITIDASGSFRGVIESALEFVKLIISGMRPDDQIQLIRFISRDKIFSVHDFSSEPSKLTDSLKQFRIEAGQSAVIDATYEAVKSVGNHRRSLSVRRAVILISDGEDRASYLKSDALIKLLREQTVQVFVVGMVLNLESRSYLLQTGSPRAKAETLLKTMAVESGGRVFFPRTNSDLVKAAAEINQSLHTSYLVAFQPTNVDKTGFRSINVRIAKRSGEELKAITRPGYLFNSKDVQEKEKKNPELVRLPQDALRNDRD